MLVPIPDLEIFPAHLMLASGAVLRRQSVTNASPAHAASDMQPSATMVSAREVFDLDSLDSLDRSSRLK
jgi:hypothetical protein